VAVVSLSVVIAESVAPMCSSTVKTELASLNYTLNDNLIDKFWAELSFISREFFRQVKLCQKSCYRITKKYHSKAIQVIFFFQALRTIFETVN
jgi:hypothetical protein